MAPSVARALASAALLLVGAGAVYDVWHPVDLSTLVCPLDFAAGIGDNVNLALGKPAECSSEFLGECSVVTDGDGACGSQGSSAFLYSCLPGAFITIDLQSKQTFDEVNVNMSSDCSIVEGFCGFEVQVSQDKTSWNTVYTARELFQFSLPGGFSFKFAEATARYVRVFVGPGASSTRADVKEVKIFLKRGLEHVDDRYFWIPINSHSSLDGAAPHIVTFIRSENEETQVDFDMVDATGKEMVSRRAVTLQADPASPPITCTCKPPTLPSNFAAAYGQNYGISCSNWDEAKCEDWWGNSTAIGTWCCWNWCYADLSCPDAYESSAVPGAYFSYSACKVENDAEDFATCSVGQDESDPCACRNVADIMDERMADMFPSDYGSTCFAWDSLSCEAKYKPWQIGSWCCVDWCYVDAACPQAQDTMNSAMLGKLFWASTPCEQDAQLVAQCPYKAQPNITDVELDACQCLELDMPAELRSVSMDADYGKTCAPHDKEYCHLWYPGAEHDMWCCSSWCWVSPTCPGAEASVIWPGQHYSSLACEWDVAAVKECSYSTACHCTGSNVGIDTAEFGLDYGTSCDAWDSASCGEWYKASDWWSNEARNDWCCQPWCYVKETCPIADPSTAGTMFAVSYGTCAVESTQVHYESTDSCDVPASCECTGVGEGSDGAYGKVCAAHDLNECTLWSGRSGLDCCTPWCFVSEGCHNSFPHPEFPGKFMSYKTCATDAEEYKRNLVDCPHSDVCRCKNDNIGVDTSFFGSDYGLQCAAHDQDDCYSWWGPDSTAGIWNSAGGNDWCCNKWCYVGTLCPVYDGFGESVNPYSYAACESTNPGETYDDSTNTCQSRRLQEVTIESCEDLFLLDGRSPVELPDTWAEAREAVKTMCLSESYDEEQCDQVVHVTFENLPDGDGLMHAGTPVCSRLLIAGAAAAASPAALLHAQQQDIDNEAIGLAAGVHSALKVRAGRESGDRLLTSLGDGHAAMDQVLLTKLTSWTSFGNVSLAMSAPFRRMKGTSSGSAGGWGSSSRSGSSAAVPVARRRTPTRPAADDSLRRRVAPKTQVRRRRSIMGKGSDRRRDTDFENDRRTTPSGQAYGYTDKKYLYDQYNGQYVMKAPYGYSAWNVYPVKQRRSIGMGTVAAAAVGGAALGVGSYYLYNQRYNPSFYGDSSWRRRRTTQEIEWCIPPESSSMDLMECTECYEAHSFCSSTRECVGSVCGMNLKRSFGRDDIIATGFIPDVFALPFGLRIYNITGPGVHKSEICPPRTPAEASLADNFNRQFGIRVDMFATLTQLDELGADNATSSDVRSGGSACETDTGYRCKVQDGSAQLKIGLDYCYGEDEQCRLSPENEYMCVCQSGYCLEGDSIETRACHMLGVAVADSGHRSSKFAAFMVITCFMSG